MSAERLTAEIGAVHDMLWLETSPPDDDPGWRRLAPGSLRGEYRRMCGLIEALGLLCGLMPEDGRPTMTDIQAVARERLDIDLPLLFRALRELEGRRR